MSCMLILTAVVDDLPLSRFFGSCAVFDALLGSLLFGLERYLGLIIRLLEPPDLSLELTMWLLYPKLVWFVVLKLLELS